MKTQVPSRFSPHFARIAKEFAAKTVKIKAPEKVGSGGPRKRPAIPKL